MTQEREYMAILRHMMAELMQRQSESTLTDKEKEECKRGIEALQAAVDAMTVQVYA